MRAFVVTCRTPCRYGHLDGVICHGYPITRGRHTPGGDVHGGVRSEAARDKGASARPPEGRVRLPASHKALPDLPSPPAARHGTARYRPRAHSRGRRRRSRHWVTYDSFPAGFSATGLFLARVVRCDGCHRVGFRKWGTYPLLTSNQFNMCNCTTPGASPRPPAAPTRNGRHGRPRPAHGHKKDRAGPGGVQRDR